MKAQELIKQAEELLRVHDNAFTNERDEAIIATFARNHMQELIDKLKKYEEALEYVASHEIQDSSKGQDALFYSVNCVRKALEE